MLQIAEVKWEKSKVAFRKEIRKRKKENVVKEHLSETIILECDRK